MAIPSTRQGLIDYALRQNGAPVLEINIEDDQISDLVDDAVQFYNERHMDGYIRTHLKVKFTQAMIDDMTTDSTTQVTGATSSAVAVDWFEQNNYLKVPEHVTSVIKVFDFVYSRFLRFPDLKILRFPDFLRRRRRRRTNSQIPTQPLSQRTQGSNTSQEPGALAATSATFRPTMSTFIQNIVPTDSKPRIQECIWIMIGTPALRKCSTWKLSHSRNLKYLKKLKGNFTLTQTNLCSNPELRPV